MPSIKHGTTDIVDVRRGATPINEIRRGSTLIWQRVIRGDDFNRPDADTLGADWTDLGPSTDRKIGITDGRARIQIPDGLLGGFWDTRVSQARYNVATNAADDGYLEVRVATKGDGASLNAILGYFTNVYFHAPDSGSFTTGVGMQLSAGHVWILGRTSSIDVPRIDGGTFQSGDRLRVVSAGYVHTLLKNGTDVGVWNDSGHTSAIGSGNRSLVIRQDGGKDILGPRRFSPALDYVLMG